MAYDPELADRLRALLSDRSDVTEKRMFGGLAFLVGGHMTVCAASAGSLMVRVDPGRTDALVARAGAERMVMRGRAMDGWLDVRPSATATDEDLRGWIDEGLTFVATLPPR